MATTDQINIYPGDHTTTPYATAGVAFRSLGVASLNIPNYPMRDGRAACATSWLAMSPPALPLPSARGFVRSRLEYQVGILQGREMRAAKNELALAR